MTSAHESSSIFSTQPYAENSQCTRKATRNLMKFTIQKQQTNKQKLPTFSRYSYEDQLFYVDFERNSLSQGGLDFLQGIGSQNCQSIQEKEEISKEESEFMEFSVLITSALEIRTLLSNQAINVNSDPVPNRFSCYELKVGFQEIQDSLSILVQLR